MGGGAGERRDLGGAEAAGGDEADRGRHALAARPDSAPPHAMMLGMVCAARARRFGEDACGSATRRRPASWPYSAGFLGFVLRGWIKSSALAFRVIEFWMMLD